MSLKQLQRARRLLDDGRQFLDEVEHNLIKHTSADSGAYPHSIGLSPLR
jgi:hypothetical protein